jgi:tetratricopeptide (TPR) repeat protein
MEVVSMAVWKRMCAAIFCAILLAPFQCAEIQAQVASPRRHTEEPRDAEAELQTGTVLTRKGSFREAIPHLLAARGRVTNEHAAAFNLALCYTGIGEFKLAINVLNELGGPDSADVENLLAQAYIGNGQPKEALAVLQKAATLSPQNEKLYMFVADACMDHKDYRLGLKVVDIGLTHLPQSAVLHYERAMLLTQMDQLDQAKAQFEQVGKLAPGSEISYLASAQQKLFEGEISDAIRSARDGVKQGHENPALLTVLGEALIRSGVMPGQPEFAEAQTALEKAVAQRPNDPASQIALGGLYLAAGRLDNAIQHLETARQIDAGNPAVYSELAKAYLRRGEQQQAQEALAVLERLNREQADRIRSAPGERKFGYASRETAEEETAQPQP